jgi:hypothetical protein
MTTKDIRTSHVHVACDVCGRTLLRGEHAETYLAGGHRRSVCDLCAVRAVHEGWVREGVALERGARGSAGERRRPLLGRLRRRASGRGERAARPAATTNGWHERDDAERAFARHAAPAPELHREERHVRAVPTSAEQRTAAAIERFNASEHPRTIAGVARSLGAPTVVARPAGDDGLVTIVVSWELCWYRYEVDLSAEGAAVRAAGQGYELSELDAADRTIANAVADEYGTLAPA